MFLERKSNKKIIGGKSYGSCISSGSSSNDNEIFTGNRAEC
jgi:hypothetical protein